MYENITPNKKVMKTNTEKSICALLESFTNIGEIEPKIEVRITKNIPSFRFFCIRFSVFVMRKSGMTIPTIIPSVSFCVRLSQK